MQTDWTAGVEKRLVDLETQHAVNAVHRVNVADRLLAIEDTLKWLVRLIIGALIVGGITYAMQGGFRV
ncbi:hemolysin XhlA family protein [Loktanella sp. M215]|uniref:hemolysin XhlA family protein n=1 Tax=Loktanella sp. M215 TaxID=2675431 RepID=UPI001F330398|nr:hemolysin XhlA family protein [Loktanella sp. M215]MBU2358701.1 hemolysin XhlA family protein [Alphaproteobacteria bacterium]MCF7700048.1 pseudouridine synthase [Loktanella sp. M215]